MREVIRLKLLVLSLLCACSDRPMEEDHVDFESRTARLTEIARVDGYQADLVTIGAGALRSDGVIAINQAQDGRLLFFDDDAAPVGSIGQPGEGPGEFRNPYRFGWWGDTLWVYDGILRRISWIGPDQKMSRIQGSIPEAARPPTERREEIPEFPFAFTLAPLEDGSMLTSFGLAVNQVVPEAYRDRSVIGRMSIEGTVESITLFLPKPEGGGVTSPDGGSASLPFGNFPQTAIAPNREKFAVAMASLSGEEVGSFALTVVDVGGDTLIDRRFPFSPEPIPAAVADSALNAVIDRLTQFSASLADAVRRDGTVPPLYPPIESLTIGNDETYWLQLRETADAQPYYVVAGDGLPTGTVRLPKGSKVLAADWDRLWVSERDDLGVNHLVRYRLEWE